MGETYEWPSHGHGFYVDQAKGFGGAGMDENVDGRQRRPHVGQVTGEGNAAVQTQVRRPAMQSLRIVIRHLKGITAGNQEVGSGA